MGVLRVLFIHFVGDHSNCEKLLVQVLWSLLGQVVAIYWNKSRLIYEGTGMIPLAAHFVFEHFKPFKIIINGFLNPIFTEINNLVGLPDQRIEIWYEISPKWSYGSFTQRLGLALSYRLSIFLQLYLYFLHECLYSGHNGLLPTPFPALPTHCGQFHNHLFQSTRIVV